MLNKLISMPRAICRSLDETYDLGLIRVSGLFDEAWYLSQNPDVDQAKINPLLHYLRQGGFEGRDPGPDFSSSKYFEDYGYVKRSGLNPLVHYLKYGKKEGCKIQPSRKVHAKLLQDKLDLIDFAFPAFKINSFADLGGVWGVEGGYTFYALDKFKLTEAVLVDTHPTNIVKDRSKNYPQLRLVQGNFGDGRIVRDVGNVDAIFLFDVLLHQVDPDWDRVLEMYAPQSRCFIIFNQQWLASQATVRLLELGEDEYFQNVPHNRTEKPYDELFQKLDQKHPDHDRNWKDVHHIWQWGITDTDLRAKVESLGFRMQFYKNCGGFGRLENFENHAYIFAK